MNLYIKLLCFTVTIGLSNQTANEHLKIVKKGLEPLSPNSVGLVFFVDVNNTSNDADFNVELIPDRCCLKQERNLDCDVLEIVGDCVKSISRGEVANLKLVVPVIHLYERYGRCTAYLDSKDVNDKRNIMRNNVEIPFDTRVDKLSRQNLPYEVKKCRNADEDPLNDCVPVDCSTFYNDKKTFFNSKKKRCVNVPTCISDNSEMPTLIYDPTRNTCIDDPITREDLEFVKNLVHGKHKKNRFEKDIVIIKKFKDSVPNITEVIDVENFNYDPFENFKKIEDHSYQKTIDKFICFLTESKWGFIALCAIILIQCGLICTMIYCLLKCGCKKKKTVEKTFFNYRTEASVTTPLMGMTITNDTETTRQYRSDSSNIDKRIKCYKACQKENKVSLSDDILAKCVTRRDWNRSHPKSANNPKNNVNYNALYCTLNKDPTNVGSEISVNKKAKMVRENKIKPKSIVKKTSSSKKSGQDLSSNAMRTSIKEYGDSEIALSEQELKCHSFKNKRSKFDISESEVRIGISEHEIKTHSYNYMDESTSLKGSSHSYSDVKNETHEIVEIYETAKLNHGHGDDIKGQASAQASFPNDSIDDFLSERGIVVLAGENISKYSFSDQSLRSNSFSSKTSKNNILKSVLSYLKRDKHGPSSEPGTNGKNKLSDNVNLELIHMSRATMYSSSNNNDNDGYKPPITEIKHSRTSL